MYLALWLLSLYFSGRKTKMTTSCSKYSEIKNNPPAWNKLVSNLKTLYIYIVLHKMKKDNSEIEEESKQVKREEVITQHITTSHTMLDYCRRASWRNYWSFTVFTASFKFGFSL